MINHEPMMLIKKALSKGMTQETIAKATGTSQPTISRCLDDLMDIENPKCKQIQWRLSNYLHQVDFGGESYFLGGGA